jgi:type IX secretion system substrate protein
MKTAVKTILIFTLSLSILIGFSEMIFAQNLRSTCTISGIVTENQTGKLLPGTEISLASYQCTTDTIGFYTITVDEGTYNILYHNPAYQDHIEENVVSTTGNNLNIDVGLWETMYGPAFVVASTNQTDTECNIDWTPTGPPQYLTYDDGTAEDYLVFSTVENAHAVKFTPPSYPCQVEGGQIYVGDGTFPVGANFLGSSITIKVFDDNGSNGKPNTVLASQNFQVNNYFWIEFDDFDIEITSGSFYIAMYQDSLPPSAVPIGIDTELPIENKSYMFAEQANYWTISPYQDYMIRAKITIDPGNDGDARNALAYKITRFSNFDPNASPLLGDSLILNDSILSSEYTDTGFVHLDPAWYAYGVAALYDQNGTKYSDYSFSNVVGHQNYFDVSFTLNSNMNAPATQSEIILEGLDFPYNDFMGNTGENTSCLIEDVWDGTYCLKIYSLNLEEYCDSNVVIHSDTSFTIQLNELLLPVNDFFVGAKSSIASWRAPELIALNEDFENTNFPPEGWQTTSNCPGWFHTNDGSSTSFFIPEWETKYACVNNNDSVTGFGCKDNLLGPTLDLRQANNYLLRFDYFFNRANDNQYAMVKISNDDGMNWIQPFDLALRPNWSQRTIDLSGYSGWETEGASKIKIKFILEDASMAGAGLAIDNVKVFATNNADWPPTGNYSVFLDDNFIDETQDTFYQYLNLVYGTEHLSGVAVNYETGLSDTSFFSFSSEWLYPPENIHLNDSNFLIWQTPRAPWPTRDSIPVNLLGFNIYKNGELLEWIPYSTGDSTIYNATSTWLPCNYLISVTGVYDLGPLGYPGQQGESYMQNTPIGLQFDLGKELPLIEDWESMGFDTNNWEVQCSNWKLVADQGNPSPCVQFNGQMQLIDYDCALISDYLNAEKAIEGDIVLSFDYKVETNGSSAPSEELCIMYWTDCEWHITETLNASQDKDWTSLELEIDVPTCSIIKVGFFCRGENSSLINFWQIDNIQLEIICPAIVSQRVNTIEANQDFTVVELFWYYEEFPPGYWYGLTDGTYENAISSTNGGAGLAQKFNIQTGYGFYIGAIRYFNSSYGNYWQPCDVYILNKAGDQIIGGPYRNENGPPDNFAQIAFAPVFLESGEFMIATFNTDPQGPNVGIDDSNYDATLYFGNIGSFDEMGQFGYYYTGSQEVYLQNEGKAQGIYKAASNVASTSNIDQFSPSIKCRATKTKSRQNYVSSIWRNGEIIKDSVLTNYTIDTIWEAGEYTYAISPNYSNCQLDTTYMGTISVYTDLKENIVVPNIKVYPNPAKELITIESSSALLQITVLDIRGKVKSRIETQGEESIQINTSDFENGIYFIKIKTEEGELTEKVAVIR